MASVADTEVTNRRDSRVAMADGEILLQRGGAGRPLLFLHGGGAGTCIGGARLSVLDDAAHVAEMEQPDLVGGAIGGFLRSS